MGIAAFGRSVPIFSSPRATLTTLWCTSNGDSLHLTFYAVQSVNVYLGHLFMYTYICLGIYVVINIIIATAEESYFVSQEKRRALDKFFERATELRPDEDGDWDVSRRDSAAGNQTPANTGGADPTRPNPNGDEAARDRLDTLGDMAKRQVEEDGMLEKLLNLVIERMYAHESSSLDR